jgi:hypothetical protein
MKEISKPSVKQYYFIRNPEGDILQEGEVRPDQVLSTNDANTISYSDKRIDIIPDMEAVLGPQVAFNDLLTRAEDGTFSWGSGFEVFESFFVFADRTVAEPLSRALYEVVNPGQEGLYARVYDHPSGETEYSVLEFRRTDIVPIALGADTTPLADALAITVEDGALTQEEVDGIVGAISAYAGQEIKLVDFIPASWADKQITKAQAIEMGYISA